MLNARAMTADLFSNKKLKLYKLLKQTLNLLLNAFTTFNQQQSQHVTALETYCTGMSSEHELLESLGSGASFYLLPEKHRHRHFLCFLFSTYMIRKMIRYKIVIKRINNWKKCNGDSVLIQRWPTGKEND